MTGRADTGVRQSDTDVSQRNTFIKQHDTSVRQPNGGIGWPGTSVRQLDLPKTSDVEKSNDNKSLEGTGEIWTLLESSTDFTNNLDIDPMVASLQIDDTIESVGDIVSVERCEDTENINQEIVKTPEVTNLDLENLINNAYFHQPCSEM